MLECIYLIEQVEKQVREILTNRSCQTGNAKSATPNRIVLIYSISLQMLKFNTLQFSFKVFIGILSNMINIHNYYISNTREKLFKILKITIIDS